MVLGAIVSCGSFFVESVFSKHQHTGGNKTHYIVIFFPAMNPKEVIYKSSTVISATLNELLFNQLLYQQLFGED